ncbi:MAG TPA: hypothetical protein VL793_14185, partial [Patescibacteria group bacterium]|nr:hypothetical protein [Patescibacteria group bacterium]
MPHGMDQVLGIDRPNLDLPLLPRMEGSVSRALLSTPQGRKLYLSRVKELFLNRFKPDELCHHLRQVDLKITPELQPNQLRWPVRGRDRRAFVMSSGNHTQDVEELCQRISTRADNLRRQLATLSSLQLEPGDK